MTRLLFSFACAVPFAALAGGGSVMLDFRPPPSNPKALAAALKAEKPGPQRLSFAAALEAKVREAGKELSDPDAIDAMAELTFRQIFEDMAAPNDVWVWTGDTGGPRGDVLIRGTVKLFPGSTTSGFMRSITVTPKGKRIDRGFVGVPCTVELAVANGVPDWRAWVASKGWGAALHPVKVVDDVARMGVTLVSPGSPTPTFERPVWVALFSRSKPDAPWELLSFEPAAGKAQKDQEVNLLPAAPKGRLTDAQRRLLLAARMEDVRLLDPSRAAFVGPEAGIFALAGLTEAPVDAKTVAWLDAYRTSEHPLVRAAAALKRTSLGAKASAADLLDAATAVKVTSVVRDALAALDALFSGGGAAPSDEDRAALAKAGAVGEAKVLDGVARVKADAAARYFKKGSAGWVEVKLAP